MNARPSLILLALLAGCTAQADYGGTEFLCEEEDVCPPGFACEDGRCVEEGSEGADGMVIIPEGSFVMGCDPGTAADCPEDAQPEHTVSLSAFEIDETEVTRTAYLACVEDGACDAPGLAPGQEPVTDVRWYQARTFCEWAGKRLPTEAEWERAARGPSAGTYPWGETPPSCTLAGFDECGIEAGPTGDRPEGASEEGVLDMAGNAAEWVADHYDPTYYERSPESDPPGPEDGWGRVIRGGSYEDPPRDLRAFVRDADDPSDADDDVGFRCAR